MLDAQPGHHLAPRGLSTGRDVFEELGAGFTLLAFDLPDGAAERFEQAAGRFGVPLRVVRDRFDGERRAYAARLVLVRPDQYVAWAGDEALDASAILERACGLASSG
jgi:hypothetical protein